MSLLALQAELLKEKAKILEELQEEWARKEVAEKLEAAHAELLEVNEIVQQVLQNAEKPNNKHKKKTAKASIRKRANPEFARLEIPVPAGQRPGNALVRLGTKPKQDRKSRRRKN